MNKLLLATKTTTAERERERGGSPLLKSFWSFKVSLFGAGCFVVNEERVGCGRKWQFISSAVRSNVSLRLFVNSLVLVVTMSFFPPPAWPTRCLFYTFRLHACQNTRARHIVALLLIYISFLSNQKHIQRTLHKIYYIHSSNALSPFIYLPCVFIFLTSSWKENEDQVKFFIDRICHIVWEG